MKHITTSGTAKLVFIAILSLSIFETRTCQTTCSGKFPNCETCTGGLVACSACKTGYLLQTGECVKCSSSCKTCSLTTDRCTSCNKGTFESRFGFFCEKCSKGCAECTSADECGTCDTGYYIKFAECFACPSGCAKCSSTSKFCFNCLQGYTNDNGTCNLDTPSEKLSGWAVAGIVVGSCLCLSCLSMFFICAFKRHKSLVQQEASSEKPGASGSGATADPNSATTTHYSAEAKDSMQTATFTPSAMITGPGQQKTGENSYAVAGIH